MRGLASFTALLALSLSGCQADLGAQTAPGSGPPEAVDAATAALGRGHFEGTWRTLDDEGSLLESPFSFAIDCAGEAEGEATLANGDGVVLSGELNGTAVHLVSSVTAGSLSWMGYVMATSSEGLEASGFWSNELGGTLGTWRADWFVGTDADTVCDVD